MSRESYGDLGAEIRRHPDDWERWLVFADWLAENGDLRGELIGLHHRRKSEGLGQSKAAELDEAIAALEARCEPLWKVDTLPDRAEVTTRNGFITGVTFPLSPPAVQRLASLLQDPRLALVGSLVVRFEADPDADYDELYDDDNERRPIEDALVDAFLELDMSPLSSLAIQYTPLSGEAAKRIVGSKDLGGLRHLDMRYCSLDDAAAEAIAAADHLDSLTTLILNHNRIGPAGVAALAGARHLAGLETLDLRDNPLSASGAAALANSTFAPALSLLRVHTADIGSEGARALGASTQLNLELRRFWAARGAV